MPTNTVQFAIHASMHMITHDKPKSKCRWTAQNGQVIMSSCPDWMTIIGCWRVAPAFGHRPSSEIGKAAIASLRFALARLVRPSTKLFCVDWNILSPAVLSRAKIVKATSNSTSDKAGLGWKIWVKKFLTFRRPHLFHLDFTAQSGGENISVNL